MVQSLSRHAPTWAMAILRHEAWHRSRVFPSQPQTGSKPLTGQLQGPIGFGAQNPLLPQFPGTFWQIWSRAQSASSAQLSCAQTPEWATLTLATAAMHSVS